MNPSSESMDKIINVWLTLKVVKTLEKKCIYKGTSIDQYVRDLIKKDLGI